MEFGGAHQVLAERGPSGFTLLTAGSAVGDRAPVDQIREEARLAPWTKLKRRVRYPPFLRTVERAGQVATLGV